MTPPRTNPTLPASGGAGRGACLTKRRNAPIKGMTSPRIEPEWKCPMAALSAMPLERRNRSSAPAMLSRAGSYHSKITVYNHIR